MKNIILLILSSLVLLLLFLFLNEQDKSKQTLAEVAKTQQSQYSDLFFYKEFFEINASTYKIKDVTCESIFNGEKKELSYLIAEKGPCLVFRYSSYNCNSCYIEQLKLLQGINIPDHQNVLILLSYRNKNDIHFSFKRSEKKLQPYRIRGNRQINNTLSDLPYYFVLYPDMKISDIYAIEKGRTIQNKKYLKNTFLKLSN